MQPKRTKYDTNPLDEKVAERASESFPSQGDAETIRLGGETTRGDDAEDQMITVTLRAIHSHENRCFAREGELL